MSQTRGVIDGHRQRELTRLEHGDAHVVRAREFRRSKRLLRRQMTHVFPILFEPRRLHDFLLRARRLVGEGARRRPAKRRQRGVVHVDQFFGEFTFENTGHACRSSHVRFVVLLLFLSILLLDAIVFERERRVRRVFEIGVLGGEILKRDAIRAFLGLFIVSFRSFVRARSFRRLFKHLRRQSFRLGVLFATTLVERRERRETLSQAFPTLYAQRTVPPRLGKRARERDTKHSHF